MKISYINATIVTQDMDRNIYQKSDLLVNGSTIAQIGTCDKAQLNSCDEVVDATGLVLLPALINTHIHL